MVKNLKVNIFRSVLAILILFIPLYPKFPLMSVENTYVAIRLDDIIIGLALLILFINQVKNKFALKNTALAKLFIIYFVAIFISLLNALFILKTDPINILILHFLRKIQYMLVAFLAVKSIDSKNDLSFPLVFMLIASFFVAVYGYGQKYFGFPIISTMNEEFSKGYLLTLTIWSRISSTFAGHYDLASFLSVFLVVLAGTIPFSNSKLFIIIKLAIWLLLFNLLTQTASRISIFALWGGLILCFILVKKYIWILPTSALIIFSFFNSTELRQRLIATLNTFTPNPQPTTAIPTTIPTPSTAPTPTKISKPVAISSPKPIITRHLQQPYPQVDVDAGVSRSGEIRFKVEWPRAMTAFSKSPIIGNGSGSLGLATDNNFLRILGEDGLLGFLSFFMIHVYFFIKTFKSKNYLNYIFMSAILTFLANAIFIDVFSASKTAYLYWIMIGIYYQNLRLYDKN